MARWDSGCIGSLEEALTHLGWKVESQQAVESMADGQVGQQQLLWMVVDDTTEGRERIGGDRWAETHQRMARMIWVTGGTFVLEVHTSGASAMGREDL